MRDWVSERVQEGQLAIWRYANPRRGWTGWQLAGDPAGCRSMRNLDRMEGGEPRHRTLTLAPVTETILRVPNYPSACREQLKALRTQYQPDQQDLKLAPEGERLILVLGDRRLRKLAAALADVEKGFGDFGLGVSDDRKEGAWMFWWWPGIRYSDGRRS